MNEYHESFLLAIDRLALRINASPSKEKKEWGIEVEKLLRGCKASRKSVLLFFPNQTTTWDSKTIYLARPWLEWKPEGQEVNLVHEAAHVRQRKNAKIEAIWSANYLTVPSFRFAVECESECWKIRYLKIIAPNNKPNLGVLAHDLIKDHLLSMNRFYQKAFDAFESEWKS